MPPRNRDNAASSSGKMSIEGMIEKLLKWVELTNANVKMMKCDLSSISQ